MGSDLDEFRQRYHDALAAFVKGDPSAQELLWSRSDDATLANPLGPPARGWTDVSATLRRAASQLHDGELLESERISGLQSESLAYTLEIERCRVKVGASREARPSSLRVTTIFRREEDGWKILHRHADPITAPRPMESVNEE